MNSNFKFELQDAFVVRVELLQKIYALLADRIGKTTISAECVDGVTRGFDSVSALIKYENAKPKRIVNLRFSAHSDDFKKSARIEFTDKWYFGGTQIDIEARDDVVTRLRSDLLDIIAGLRPWYYALNKIDVFLAALVLYSAFWLAIMLLVAINGVTTTSESSLRESATAQLIFIGSTVIYFGCTYIIHRFRRLIFPHGTFAIGQEIHRIDTLDKLRWGGVVAFLASLAAGIVLLALQ